MKKVWSQLRLDYRPMPARLRWLTLHQMQWLTLHQMQWLTLRGRFHAPWVALAWEQRDEPKYKGNAKRPHRK